MCVVKFFKLKCGINFNNKYEQRGRRALTEGLFTAAPQRPDQDFCFLDINLEVIVFASVGEALGVSREIKTETPMKSCRRVLSC